METQLEGPITKYIDLIGRGIDGIQEQVDKATNGLAGKPLIEDTDESFLGAGSTESYWSYYSAGLELQWRNDILVVLSLYLQDDSLYEEPYVPLTYKLLTSLSNTASIQEVINTFGDPEFEGGLWGRKNLRYRLDADKFIIFRFNDKGTLWAVQIGLYRILRNYKPV